MIADEPEREPEPVALKLTLPAGAMRIMEGSQPIYRVTLTRAHAADVQWAITDAPGTAAAGIDYEPGPTSGVIPAGQTKGKGLLVDTVDDDVVRPDRTLVVTLTTESGVPVGVGSMTVTITDDDILIASLRRHAARETQVRLSKALSVDLRATVRVGADRQVLTIPAGDTTALITAPAAGAEYQIRLVSLAAAGLSSGRLRVDGAARCLTVSADGEVGSRC